MGEPVKVIDDPDVTLWHGDALAVLPTLEAESVDCIICDPPYAARRPSARRLTRDRFDEVENNDSMFTDWIPGAFRVLRDGGAIYAFTCWDRLEDWRSALSDAGLKTRSCIVWDKMMHGLADLKTCWAPQHELILFAAKGRHLLGGKRPKDIIQAMRVDSKKLRHPYQKPIAAIAPMIEASTRPGDLVADLFAGSGTTLVACRKSGGRCIGVESADRYIPVIKRRLAEAATPLFSGVTP